ncbi:MAG: DNA-binding protein [Chloroflexi bacterium]|jgi:predicted histone-like DNA-binding protein|nr:DNA-binding protein [Chloroflexota bacterium]
MSVKYNSISRKKPGDPEAAPKYYPSIVKSGNVKLRTLSKRIAEISTVSTVDTMAVLEGLLAVLPQELAAGNVVRLGDFGSFWLRIKTQGSDTPEAVTTNDILNVLPRFTPGKEFKQVLETIEFEKA